MAAFIVAMGAKPPVIQHLKMPAVELNDPHKVSLASILTLSATLDRLIPPGGAHWALIIKEVDQQGGHSASSALSVAYLHDNAGSWTLDYLWPEIAFGGSFGVPANAGEEDHRFGRHSLFFAREEWCGMGECSGRFDTIALEPAGPVAFDSILASTRYPAIADYPLDSDCPTYDSVATIGPPRSSAGLFSVTYAGWTTPEHGLHPRFPLRWTTDYVRSGRSALRMSPKVPAPDCNR